MTKEQLEAENERLGKEVAALRTLLAAARDAADVPMPDYVNADGRAAYIVTCERRLDLISVYANPDGTFGPCTPDTLHNSAKTLRDEAAKPLRYAPKAKS